MFSNNNNINIDRGMHVDKVTLPIGPEGPGGLPIVVPTEQPSTEEPVAAEDVRTFFPESWIFKLMRAE